MEGLTFEELMSEMKEIIREVSEVTDDRVPETSLRLLLNKLGWNKTMLLERLYEREDAFDTATDNSYLKSFSELSVEKQTNFTDPIECEICCLHFPPP